MNDLNDYQKLALRTMADQAKIANRNYLPESAAELIPTVKTDTPTSVLTQLDNASRGLGADAGEVLSCVQRCLEYGKPLDLVNLKEELGDVLWRIVQACDAVGFTLQEVADANIAKLAKRYPDKYTDTLAHEENRDREAEREAIVKANASPAMEFIEDIVEQTGQGFAEPPEEREEPYTYASGFKVGDVVVCGNARSGLKYNSPMARVLENRTVKVIEPPNKDGWPIDAVQVSWESGQGAVDASWISKKVNIRRRRCTCGQYEEYPQFAGEWPEGHSRVGPCETVELTLSSCEAPTLVVKPPAKLVPDPFSDTLETALTSSYDRYCLICTHAKVHKTNSLQVCGDCYPRYLKMKEEGTWGGFLANR